MRTRASAALTTGALALSALMVPAAHASGGDSRVPADLPTPFAASSSAAGKITKVTVNGGKPIAVGTSKKKFTVEVSASNEAGVLLAIAALWRGSDFDNPDVFLEEDDTGSADPCKYTATTATCKYTFTADPRTKLANKYAGSWKVAGMAIDGTFQPVALVENFKSVKVLRAAKLTANAAPEPIKKGKTLTVTGALTRANWDTEKYAGYTSQPVKLQYQKRGSSAWSTVKTVKSDGRGNLKTTVKATADGSFRYSFAGTSTTPAVNSGADYVDVR
ncbi:calcium-binding protein [Streptomyces uncialis]|uniref:calcium-binding protein n=1 Tax=Streptomyces uncialis TaxID=1048205 RepID=UPI00364B18E7